jgi:hypothetical protein
MFGCGGCVYDDDDDDDDDHHHNDDDHNDAAKCGRKLILCCVDKLFVRRRKIEQSQDAEGTHHFSQQTF